MDSGQNFVRQRRDRVRSSESIDLGKSRKRCWTNRSLYIEGSMLSERDARTIHEDCRELDVLGDRLVGV